METNIEFSASIKKVVKASGAPEVTLTLSGSEATHVAAKLMNHTSGNGLFTFEPAQQTMDVDDEDAPEVDVTEGQQQMVADPDEAEAVEPVGEDEEVPFETDEVPADADSSASDEVEEQAEPQAEGDGLEYLDPKVAHKLIVTAIESEVDVVHEDGVVTYTVARKGDDKTALITLSIEGPGDADFRRAAALEFFKPVSIGLVQMSQDAMKFRVGLAEYRAAVAAKGKSA